MVGAFEIILQGTFEQAGDFIGVVAERTSAPGAKYDAAGSIFTTAARVRVQSPCIISIKSGAVSA